MIGEPHEGCAKNGKWIDVGTFAMPNRMMCTGCREQANAPPVTQSPEKEAARAYETFLSTMAEEERRARRRQLGFYIALGVALTTAVVSVLTALADAIP